LIPPESPLDQPKTPSSEAPRPTTGFESLVESDERESTPRPRDSTAASIALIHELADKLATDGVSPADAKLLAFALRELRHCFRVFAPHRGVRKATIFGSARTQADHPAYQAAVQFARELAESGWMVITGAAAGIMEAGHVGAGRDASFGLNILLPFEQSANPVIEGDPKLVNMRYFFTRKLMLIKECDAIVLFPGGFGTHDEAFEALTLIQTGKSHLFPIVLVDEPQGTYWQHFDRFIREELLARGYISPADLSLYRITDSVAEAVAEVRRFYRVYHSQRFVRKELILRLTRAPRAETLSRIRTEFSDLLTQGTFELSAALPEEANEPQLADWPRLRFYYHRTDQGRLRQLINVLNDEPA
jgi:uncharacterized protein (TIGR00730 family)